MTHTHTYTSYVITVYLLANSRQKRVKSIFRASSHFNYCSVNSKNNTKSIK